MGSNLFFVDYPQSNLFHLLTKKATQQISSPSHHQSLCRSHPQQNRKRSTPSRNIQQIERHERLPRHHLIRSGASLQTPLSAAIGGHRLPLALENDRRPPASHPTVVVGRLAVLVILRPQAARRGALILLPLPAAVHRLMTIVVLRLQAARRVALFLLPLPAAVHPQRVDHLRVVGLRHLNEMRNIDRPRLSRRGASLRARS
jgi:mRNA-degrading endonuclease toxin of MazEF toxin-antitoxin module